MALPASQALGMMKKPDLCSLRKASRFSLVVGMLGSVTP